MARDSSDMAIFDFPRRQNIDGGRPNTVIGKGRVDTSSYGHILHHVADSVVAQWYRRVPDDI